MEPIDLKQKYVAKKLKQLHFNKNNKHSVDQIAKQIILSTGKKTRQFLESAIYFDRKYELQNYEFHLKYGSPETFEKIHTLLRKNLTPKEVRIAYYSPEEFIAKLTKAKSQKLLKIFEAKSVESLEEIEAIIIASELELSDYSEIKQLLELGYTKDDIKQIIQHDFADSIITYRFLSSGKPFQSNNYQKLLDKLYLENFSSQEKQLFLALDPEFDMNDIYFKFPFKKTEKWNHYVIRNEEFIKKSEFVDDDQVFYGSCMHQGSQIGAFGIKSHWTFHQMLAVLSRFRRDFAIDIIGKNRLSYVYGLNRKIDYKTELNNEYLKVLKWAKTQKTEKNSPFLHLYRWKDNHPQIVTTIGKIENYAFPLSSIIIPFEIVYHTKPKYIAKILIHTDKLYQEALKMEDLSQLNEKLGEIFWWICRAKPWERGDPSIAEMLIKAVYLFQGIQPPTWKKGIVPWIEVELQPDVKTYAKNFHKLLEFPNHS